MKVKYSLRGYNRLFDNTIVLLLFNLYLNYVLNMNQYRVAEHQLLSF